MFFKIFKFSIRDAVWAISLLSVICAWAADRQWRFIPSYSEKLGYWQFRVAADMLKFKTADVAELCGNGNVIITYSNGSTEMFIKPNYIDSIAVTHHKMTEPR